MKLLNGSKKKENLRSKMKLHISVYKLTNQMCALKNTKRKSPKIIGKKIPVMFQENRNLCEVRSISHLICIIQKVSLIYCPPYDIETVTPYGTGEDTNAQRGQALGPRSIQLVNQARVGTHIGLAPGSMLLNHTL